MRKSVIGLVSLVAPAILGMADAADTANAGFETLCGPCGLVSTGDIGISGNAKVDGFFSAVATLNTAVTDISVEFETNIDELLLAFGVEGMAEATLEAKVEALKAEIDAEITANASGGLTINYVPPRCDANVNVAVQAQAKCEVKAGCEVEVDPGEVSVSCEGTCEGSCEGSCMGEVKCDMTAGATCEGMCEGSCEISGAVCEGTCRGSCEGTCSAKDNEGNCQGKCEGMCTGNCELNVAAECSGTCTGSCKVDADVGCEGEVTCSGQCMGECKGSCQGTARPPSASAECDASADCEAQASAQASASIECRPPRFEIGFEFTGDVDARASFDLKMAALSTKGVAILRGFANYEALISGKVAGEVVYDPSPAAELRTSIQGLVTAGVDGELFAGIPAGRITCALGAFEESVEILNDTLNPSGELVARVQAQADFAGSLTTGDFSD
jgi:modification target Cys-rich repeat protein